MLRTAVCALLVAVSVSDRPAFVRLAAAPVSSPAGPDAFTDADVDRLLKTLDTELAATTDPAAWAGAAKMALWNFTRQVQARRLSPAQETSITAKLTAIARQHPDVHASVSQFQRVIRTLTVGKTAPEIVGRDLDDVEFRLSDYRGKVVVVMFSGNWCGICRSEYPYERQLLELYRDAPFALLTVNSDRDRVGARKALQENGLTNRSWWDGPPGGPIASAWGIVGWPTAYLIDAQGVIRFVDPQNESLIANVQQLMTEPAMSGARSSR